MHENLDGQGISVAVEEEEKSAETVVKSRDVLQLALWSQGSKSDSLHTFSTKQFDALFLGSKETLIESHACNGSLVIHFTIVLVYVMEIR